MTFTRLTWFRADGARIVVEKDGQVWKIGPRDRTLRLGDPPNSARQKRDAVSLTSAADQAFENR